MELELGNSTGRGSELAMAAASKRQRAFASEIMLSKATTRGTSRRVTRTCQHDNCGKNPYFGWHGGKAIYCVAHKEAGKFSVLVPSLSRIVGTGKGGGARMAGGAGFRARRGRGGVVSFSAPGALCQYVISSFLCSS